MLRLASWTFLATILIAHTPLTGSSDGPQGQTKPRTAAGNDLESIMKKKLAHAQKVLEAIALNDPAQIRAHAEELIVLSKQADWMVLRTPEYELHTDSFRRSAQDLVRAANDKNVDGSALAYVELTMSCVKCHKYVRDTRRTQFMPLSGRVFARLAR